MQNEKEKNKSKIRQNVSRVEKEKVDKKMIIKWLKKKNKHIEKERERESENGEGDT